MVNGGGVAKQLMNPMKTFNTRPKPTFIYFDLGGVVLKDFTSSDKGLDMLTDLGVDPAKAPRFRELWNTHAEPRVCLDYDADDFQPIIEQEFGVQLPQDYSLLQHGFVDRFESNPGIVPVLMQLNERVKTGLLTNMYPRMLKAIKSTQGLMPTVLWDVIIDSSEVGLQKPDIAIFAYATQLAAKPKEQILFIDNTVENLDVAAAYGWQAYYYNSANYEKSNEQLGQYLTGLL